MKTAPSRSYPLGSHVTRWFVVALALLPLTNTELRAQPQSDPVILEEGQRLSRSVDTLRAFDEQAQLLNKSDHAPSAPELEKLKVTAERAKSALRDIAGTAAMLFLNNRKDILWDSVESDFEKKAKEAKFAPEFLRYIQKEGGIKGIMRRLPQALRGGEDSIDTITGDLSSGRKWKQGLLNKLITESAYATCRRCHCIWYAVAAAILMDIPGGQPAAIGAAGAGLACALAP